MILEKINKPNDIKQLSPIKAALLLPFVAPIVTPS